MKEPSSLHLKFANAFADAILARYVSSKDQEIFYVEESDEYQYRAVKPGTAPSDVDFYVGATWDRFIGDQNDPAVKQGFGFEPNALRSLIVKKLCGIETIGQLAVFLTMRAADRPSARLQAVS